MGDYQNTISIDELRRRNEESQEAARRAQEQGQEPK